MDHGNPDPLYPPWNLLHLLGLAWGCHLCCNKFLPLFHLCKLQDINNVPDEAMTRCLRLAEVISHGAIIDIVPSFHELPQLSSICSRTTPAMAPVNCHFQPHPNPNPQMLNTAQSYYMGGEDDFPTAMHLEVDYMLLDGVADSEGGTDYSNLALEAAKAKRKVCKAEKHLANCIIEHQVMLLNIWCHRVEVANFRLLMVDLNVGHLHMERKKSSILTFIHSEGTQQ
ncbi:hypothetical protein BDR07DRAFT_1381436 [Suillus spraguei]|nr:hypothetical protein BDR07DRAFT_1381436 [Suillus spraguei]